MQSCRIEIALRWLLKENQFVYVLNDIRVAGISKDNRRIH